MGEPTVTNLKGGTLVEIDTTGDLETDHARVLQLLKDHGIKRATRAQAMGMQAHSFATVAADIYRKDLQADPRNLSSIAPFIVNSAFSIELHLKTLGQIHNKPLKGHELLVLYDALPPDAYHSIDKVLPDCIKKYGPTSGADVRTCISGLNDAYREWRYYFELARTRTVHFEQLIFLLNVLDEASRSAVTEAAKAPPV
jgi:hypothetical protein